ncbi:MAG: hypothetical protein ACKOJF_15510, partial [Planctomycetaceae bacterium]
MIAGKFDQGLDDTLEEFIAAESVLVQVVVDFLDVPVFPKVHDAVDAVDYRNCFPCGGFVAHILRLPLVPGLELDLPAASRVIGGFGVPVGFGIIIGITRRPIAETGMGEHIPGPFEFRVSQTARRSIEDASPNGGVFHLEIIAVEEVVSGHVIKAIGGNHICGVPPIEDLPDDVFDYHAPNVDKKLGDTQGRVR